MIYTFQTTPGSLARALGTTLASTDTPATATSTFYLTNTTDIESTSQPPKTERMKN